MFHRHSAAYGVPFLTWPDFIGKVIQRPDVEPPLGASTAAILDWPALQTSVGSHWEPLWRACSVCHPALMPEIILKLETLPADLEEYLGQRLGLGNDVVRTEDFLHMVQGATDTGRMEAMYYGQLTRSQILELAQIYKLDLELFGYDAESYLELSKE